MSRHFSRIFISTKCQALACLSSYPFFTNCRSLDYLVLRPLSHIHSNWELTWDDQSQLYEAEDDSYAEQLNALIEELAQVNPPAKYHDNEDRLTEYVRKHLNWKIQKVGNRWIGADYESIL